MTTRVVCDASAVVAMLLDPGPDGRWASGAMTGAELFAPTLLPYECANIIRRHEISSAVSADQAAQAHADLRDLAVTLWPYEILGSRVWELRHNLSCYDASYVAVAEALTAPLLTLDSRIRGAPGLECAVLEPPSR
ncbi:MAG: type II toxin-antitoxin system VapC family toxin [Mycolicibacterium sp.]|uniref:type II toxin-antitoxin system VapC family toxin n=1 Tax=Mycolicibacterium sp. TaxID=2320850 RepID=UPI003D151BAA